MDAQSVNMIFRLVAQGVGVAEELAALARRVEAGGTVTDTEIREARERMRAAVDRWNAAAGEDRE